MLHWDSKAVNDICPPCRMGSKIVFVPDFDVNDMFTDRGCSGTIIFLLVR